MNIKQWKTKWDEVLNDTQFRQEFTGGHGDYNLGERIREPRGTIYIHLGDEGHFIGYKKVGQKIYTFNPARPGTKWGMYNIGQRLPYFTQFHPEDTFCQTWTLAWLVDEQGVSNIRSEDQSINYLYNFCKRFDMFNLSEKQFKKLFFNKRVLSLKE